MAPGEGGPAARSRRDLARKGEEAAAAWAGARGWRVLERNYRCRLGEIDLIARDGDTVVFVEVKARRGSGFGEPGEAVDGRKRARLGRVARHFLLARGLWGAPCRFDVAAVRVDRRGEAAVEWISDAFRT